MSFSMDVIKTNKTKNKNASRIQKAIKMYTAIIDSDDRLTDIVKCALKRYANFRVTKRYVNEESCSALTSMINKLLQYCCNKSYLDVSYDDVKSNEVQIVYEIKKAVYYGALHSLYYLYGNQEKVVYYEETIDCLKIDKIEDTDDVISYFSDLDVI